MRSRFAQITLSALIAGSASSAMASVPPLSTQYGSYIEPVSRNVKVTKQAPVKTTIPSPPPVVTTTESPSYAIQDRSLMTGTALEVGAQFSNYKYEEPDSDVSLKGLKYGLTASASRKFGENWFAKGEGRFAYGDVNYEGSGTHDNEEDYIIETRMLVGKDFLFNRFSISPHIGLGYRYLSNDGRGETSTGANGYRRESQYVYFPIGFHNRIRTDEVSRINWSLEYDQLIWGQQNSELGDVAPYYGRVENAQHTGYGFRGDAMYERNSWAIGPFFNYWNISQSDEACSRKTYGGALYTSCGWVEPKNETTELGLQFKYRVF